jgi:hypothetical protein
MDKCISKKKLISQFEPFEKPKFLILFGYGAWTWDMYEHVWNLHGTWKIWTWGMGHVWTFMKLTWHMEHLDMAHEHGTCMNMYETWTWGMGMGYVWTCMKLGHGAWDMYEHVWNLNMGHFNTWHGQGACMNMYETWTWNIWTWDMGRVCVIFAIG